MSKTDDIVWTAPPIAFGAVSIGPEATLGWIWDGHDCIEKVLIGPEMPSIALGRLRIGFGRSAGMRAPFGPLSIRAVELLLDSLDGGAGVRV